MNLAQIQAEVPRGGDESGKHSALKMRRTEVLAGSSPAHPMKHKHHILPKYRGGTDSKDNIVELSVTQHAMFHYCNWQLWGEWEDYYAWRGLSGEVGKEEIIAEARKRGRRKGSKLGMKKIAELWKNDPEFREKRMQHSLRVLQLAIEAAKSDEARQKRKESFQTIKHQQGERNSQYGTMWITNGTINKKKSTKKTPYRKVTGKEEYYNSSEVRVDGPQSVLKTDPGASLTVRFCVPPLSLLF